MDHAPRHLYNGTIWTFRHSVLLWPIRYRRFFGDAVVYQKLHECLGHEFSAIVRTKRLALVLGLHFHKRLEFLETYETFVFGLQYVQPHIPREIVNEGDKMLCTAHECGAHGST